jgi:hypothetical protein
MPVPDQFLSSTCQLYLIDIFRCIYLLESCGTCIIVCASEVKVVVIVVVPGSSLRLPVMRE